MTTTPLSPIGIVLRARHNLADFGTPGLRRQWAILADAVFDVALDILAAVPTADLEDEIVTATAAYR